MSVPLGYRLHLLAFAVGVTLLVAACANPTRLAEPIGTFRTATAATATVVRPALAEVNAIERAFSLQEALANGQDLNGRTFINPVFDSEGLAARQLAFTLIDLYTLRLAELADAETGDQVRAAAGTVANQLGEIGNTINRLDPGSGDDLARYSGPLSDLFQAVAGIWVDAVRERALEDAIDTAGPAIDQILSLLETDMRRSVQAQEQLAFERAAAAIEAFNLGAPDQRQELGETALQLANSYERITTTSPEDVIESMRTAHTAMVEATRVGSDTNFEAFVASVNVFSIRAAEAAAVYRGFVRASRT